MKQIYTTFFFVFISVIPFGTTFDWETAIDNGSTVTQTVNSITATVTTSNSNAQSGDLSFLGGRNGTTVFTETTNDNTSLTITFNTQVDVTSIIAFIADLDFGGETDILFTPTGGTNSPITEGVDGMWGEVVTLNWEGVTAITLTVNGGGLESFGIDDIRLGTTLSSTEFDISENKVELFPNPSNSFINVSGLQRKESYSIFNTLGKKVLKGEVSINKPIDIQNLTKGLYFLKFKNATTLKFIKN